MEIIEQISNELSSINPDNIVTIVLCFGIAFYFSNKAISTSLRVLYFVLGCVCLSLMTGEQIILDMKFIVALGLILPQIRFIIFFTKNTIETIKMMSVNTYYFFVTIWYKIIRFINWTKSLFSTLKIFFTTFSFKKENNTNQKQYEYREQSSFYERTSSNQSEESSYDKRNSNTRTQENSKTSTQGRSDKYERFYSDNAYIVLGISTSDDFSTIKKQYKKLVRIYHPDLNPDDIKLFTEITQNINEAYGKLEKKYN